MACEMCAKVDASNQEKPFIPSNGTQMTHFFDCKCGQSWQQFNQEFHLWVKISATQREQFRAKARA